MYQKRKCINICKANGHSSTRSDISGSIIWNYQEKKKLSNYFGRLTTENPAAISG
jgi:hypothetical protein